MSKKGLTNLVLRGIIKTQTKERGYMECGVPFGTNDVPKTIVGAYNMDDKPLIEL